MSKQTEAFINKYKQDVIQATKGTNIYPSVTMAQMIIESSGKNEKGIFEVGGGLLARKGNNFFGVKAEKGYKGQLISLPTPRDKTKKSLFRVYPNALDSIKDHSQFLLKNSRYKKAGVFEAKNPQAQTKALLKAFYSESPTYNLALNKLISAYHLEKLDQEAGKKSEKSVLMPSLLILALLGGGYYYTSQKRP